MKHTKIDIRETHRYKGETQDFEIKYINTSFSGTGIFIFAELVFDCANMVFGYYPNRPIEYCDEFEGCDEDLVIEDDV